MGNEVQGHTVQSTRFARTSAPTQHAETKIPPVRRMVCSSGNLEADIRLRKKPSRKAIWKPGHYVKCHGSTQVPFHLCRGRDCCSERQMSYSQKAHTRCTVENAAKEVLRVAFGETASNFSAKQGSESRDANAKISEPFRATTSPHRMPLSTPTAEWLILTLCMHVYEMHTYKIHAHKTHAREMHAYEVYAHEVYAHETHACEVHIYKTHDHETHAHKTHAHEMYAHEMYVYRYTPVKHTPMRDTPMR
jgi:hypothetical protein